MRVNFRQNRGYMKPWSILIWSQYQCNWSSTYPTKHMRFSSRLRYTAHPGDCMLHRSTRALSSEHIQFLWSTNIANLLGESWGFWVSLPETSQVPVLLAGNGKYEWASVCLLLLACFLEVASANKFQNTRVWDKHGVQQLKSQISQAKDTGSKTFYPQSNKWQYQNIRMHLAGHHVAIISTQSVILFQKYP